MQGGPGRIIKRADPATIQDKFLVGYQGWFTCPGDGEPISPGHHGWLHWFGSPIPDGGHPNVDLWPDVSEYDPSELYPATGLKYQNGEQAFLFSSRNAKTVQRHFHWMARHGVDGAFLQRFLSECEMPRNEGIRRVRDEVGARVREASEKEGRVFAIMYDFSGVPADRVLQVITRDWCHLVYEEHILDSPNYLREKRKAVVGLWGLGFAGRGHTPALMRSVCDFISSATPGGAYLFAGVPTHWRTGTGDAESDPAFRDLWLNAFDAISPWTIGRFSDENEADRFAEDVMKPDVELIKRHNDEAEMKGERKIDYVPVVFPGGSGYNMTEGKWAFNGMKRNGGKFFWKQIFNARRQGARVMYGAMWDEYDEGTAFMPVVEKKRQLPHDDANKFQFLALDADGLDIPSDWYMRICGFAAEGVRSERRIHESFPSKELQDYWATRPRYEDVDQKSGDFISGSSSSAGTASAGGSGSGSGSGSGGRNEEGGQSYEEWLATQKEKGDEPPPPPYTLEADEPSAAEAQPQPQAQTQPAAQMSVPTQSASQQLHSASSVQQRPSTAASAPNVPPQASTTSTYQPRVESYANPSAPHVAGGPVSHIAPHPGSSQTSPHDQAFAHASSSTSPGANPYPSNANGYTNPNASQLAGAPGQYPGQRPPSAASGTPHGQSYPPVTSPTSPGTNFAYSALGPSGSTQGYPPATSHPQGRYPPYAADPVGALASDFGRQHIATPGSSVALGISGQGGPAPAASRPPLHPSHPQASGQSQHAGPRPPSRPQTGRPTSQQGSRPPPPQASRPPQAQSPQTSPGDGAAAAQWPPAEWQVKPAHQQPHHAAYPAYSDQPMSPPPHVQSSSHAFPSTHSQEHSQGQTAGANLTRPHTFSARPSQSHSHQHHGSGSEHTSPTSPLRPHASVSHGSIVRPSTANSHKPTVGQGMPGGYPQQQQAPAPASSTYPGQRPSANYSGPASSSNYPGQVPSSNYPGHASSSTYPGQSQMPSSTYPGQPPVPSSTYPGQPSASTYPGQAHTSSYPGQTSPAVAYHGQTSPSSYPGQSSYQSPPPGAPSFPPMHSGPSSQTHSPTSPLTSLPGSSSYGAGVGAGPGFPEVAGPGAGFFNIPQPATVPGAGHSGYPSAYGPHTSQQQQGHAPYYAPSGSSGFPQPNAGGYSPPLPASSPGQVPPPMPPRPTTSSGSNTSSASGVAFPTAHTSGGPLGFALNAVDRVAGRQTRDQLENLAQTGSKFFNKLTR